MKSRASFLPRLFLALSLLSAAAVPACDEHSHDEEEAQIPAGYEDVELYGEVTDEALVVFAAALEQGTVEDASRAATLDFPADGAMIPKEPIPQLAWHAGGATGRSPVPGLAPLELFPHRAAPAPPTPESVFTALFPVRSAHAHGAPFNGTGTFLTLSTPDDPKLVRVFTSQSVYQPSVLTWAKLTAVTGPITVTLVSAEHENNQIIQNGGPIQGSTTTFSFMP